LVPVPTKRLRAALLEKGLVSEPDLNAIDAEIQAEVLAGSQDAAKCARPEADTATQQEETAARPKAASAKAHVYSEAGRASYERLADGPVGEQRKISFVAAT